MDTRMVRGVADAGRWAAAALAALALACGLTPPEDAESPGGTEPHALPPAGYRLVWADEFDGGAVDVSSWNVMSGTRRDRDSLMSPSSVSVANGVLELTTFTAGGTHHAGFLTTEGLFEATYGYFEARIRFRDSPGEWCAFWLVSPTVGKPLGDPATAGVEIDVVEHRVTDQGGWDALRDMVAINLNWDGYGSSRKNVQKVVGLPDGGPIQGAWRTYSVLWTESGYTFYVDAVPLFSTSTAVSRRSEYVLLSCEVLDGSWAGDVPPDGYGSRAASTTGMDVDWVRVWQP